VFFESPNKIGPNTLEQSFSDHSVLVTDRYQNTEMLSTVNLVRWGPFLVCQKIYNIILARGLLIFLLSTTPFTFFNWNNVSFANKIELVMFEINV